jgi:hypothetical protein
MSAETGRRKMSRAVWPTEKSGLTMANQDPRRFVIVTPIRIVFLLFRRAGFNPVRVEDPAAGR